MTALAVTNLAHSTAWLAGAIPDLPTPFDNSDRIDLAAFARLCERQIQAGVSAIVAGETAGEASTLTPAEHEIIIRAAVEVARGRVRVIAGAGSNSTGQAIELTRRAETAGADAVLSVVPYYNKPMQSGMQAHFQAIAASSDSAGGGAINKMLFAPFRSGTTHVMIFRPISARRSVPGWTEKRRQGIDRAAEKKAERNPGRVFHARSALPSGR